MFSAVTTSLVLICVKYVNPVDVMLWKGWKSRELVWECKATQDFPTIIAPTIILSCYHCPHHLTFLLSLPQLSYYPVVIAPLYKWTPLSYMPSKRLCKVCMSTETLANKIQRIMALVTDISPMFLSSLPLV